LTTGPPNADYHLIHHVGTTAATSASSFGRTQNCLPIVKAKPLAIPPRAGEVTCKCLLAADRLRPGKDKDLLFHDQIILYSFDPFNGIGNFNCSIDGLLRINEAGQLNNALVSFDTDLE
jgi:hypothetical protein